MAIKAVLFDLDGTLLPMDIDVFTQRYFSLLSLKLADKGYVSDKLVQAIFSGIKTMVKNDGTRTNEDAFWDEFVLHFGEKSREDIPHFESFYKNEFEAVKDSCGHAPLAVEAVAKAKEKGCLTVLATNPIFPAVATEKRMGWAGLYPDDFAFYTTYENSCHCKPNLAYYEDIVGRLGLLPEECLMVGNDVAEDMVAETLGMKVFLLTDCLLNKYDADISSYPQGGFLDLLRYMEENL